jgi:D-alanyl-D-alanine carboxypeptidase/D-alanyl-D-alanine-endopeptidase (penicillin-binding protein 4)
MSLNVNGDSMKRALLNSVVILGTSLTASGALASKIKASCYLQDGEGKALQGVNVDERHEIASVSKVMTAYWAVKKMGTEGRFPTVFHITPVANNLYDVHIQGSHDPYFGRQTLQFLVSELNQIGVSHIRSLTFDEKFRFLEEVRGRSAAQGHFQLDAPSDHRVMVEMRGTLNALTKGYDLLSKKAQDGQGLRLRKSIALRVDSIEFKSTADFVATPETRAHVYMSAPVHVLLKEMNRNSNNYAAHQIFEALGGAEEFQKFIKADLNLEEKEIKFVNGSGDRLDLVGNKSVYNEATCRSVVKIVRALDLEMQRQKSSILDVMAVAGEDPSENERSTVTALYNADSTSGALVAKTGTVNPSVTLAGMISTNEGDVYFGYIYGTKGTAADWRDARGMIRSQVFKLMSNFGGKKEVSYDAHTFLPFDQKSELQLMKIESESAK